MSRTRRGISMRARLTWTMATIAFVAFSVLALVAPTAVRPILEDDLLAAEAQKSSLLFTLGVPSAFDPDDLIEITDGELFGIDADVLVDVGEMFGDFFSGFGLDDDELEAAARAEIELLQGIDRLDLLTEAADGPFVIELGPTIGAEVDTDGSFRLVDDLDTVIDDGIPVISSEEIDDLLTDDVGLRPVTRDSFIETDPDARTIAGVVDVDGTPLLVAADAAAVDRSVARVQRGLWLAVPLLTMLVAGVAWVLISRALRPVGAITERASTISGGSLDARVPVPRSGDEISTLALTVNEMLDRLEGDDRARRRFISDASHELRSPVAVMRNDAEVALRYPDTADVGRLAVVVADESARLSTIIDDLLTLARHDEGVIGPVTDIDLDDIVIGEADRTRRVPVDSSQVSAGRVRGRQDELTRLVAHLLDNAARHARSTVSVALRSSATHVELIVDDDGPGVAPADRERIFERFVRLDDARTRDAGGAGLGLAVVRGIAERSGGTVRVDTSPLGGARFTVDFAV
ncbi:ATP-binding protein [Ilumatobacter sp.]|uniref:sensor histidine kinase n=1 Tax=Ilumatobacter sp. TaxID=1967498 RepID=UPI003C67013F